MPFLQYISGICTPAVLPGGIIGYIVPSIPLVTHKKYTSTAITPTKRQDSKRQVSKRLVSKRLVSKRLKRQVYKTSALQNVRLQNVKSSKRQVFKTSGCKKNIHIFLTCGWRKSAGSVAAMFAGKMMAVFYSLF